MRIIKSSFIIFVSLVIILFSLPINVSARTEAEKGTLKITTAPAGADVYINGERYVQKCTPCTVALDEGNYEIKLSIKGYEDFSGSVQIEAGKETVLEKTLLPEIPAENATVITVTTEDDTEDDFCNTEITAEDLKTAENVSLRLALRAIQNDTTDNWYRIEFAENVNHIDLINDTVEITRGNLIINGDRDRNGTPDVLISKSYGNLIFRHMDNLYIMGLEFGSEYTSDCPVYIRPNDFSNDDVSYENIYLLGCKFTNCTVIPFCGGCKVYNSSGSVDYTNINACGNTLINSNLFFAYSGNIDKSTADGISFCANKLDDNSVISPQCVDCNTNYIYGPDTEEANGGTPGAYETSDGNTVRNYLLSGNYGGRLVCSAAVLGNCDNHLINVTIRNNCFTDYAFIRVCQPIDDKNVGNTIVMNNNSIENLTFEYNVLINQRLYLSIASFDSIDDSTSYRISGNLMKNVRIADNLYVGNDNIAPDTLPNGVLYEYNGGIVPVCVYISDHEGKAKNVEFANNGFEGLVIENNRKAASYDPYAIWDDSPVHEHTTELIASVKATENEYGTREYWHCTGCGKYFSDSSCETEISDLKNWLQNEGRIAKLTHKYISVVTAPTCTTDGYTTYTCPNCGDSYIGNTVHSTGHKFDKGTITKAATCITDGIITYKCTVNGCGATYTETIKATGYKSGDVNGDGHITVSDARFALRGAIKLTDKGIDLVTPTGKCFKAADVTADGEITVEDARLILRMAIGL